MNLEQYKASLKEQGKTDEEIATLVDELISKAVAAEPPPPAADPEVSVESIQKALEASAQALAAGNAVTPEKMEEEIKKAVDSAQTEADKKLQAVSAATDQLVRRQEGHFEQIRKALDGFNQALSGVVKLYGQLEEKVGKSSIDVEAVVKAVTDKLPVPEPKATLTKQDIVDHPGDNKNDTKPLDKETAKVLIQKAVKDGKLDAQNGNQALQLLLGTASSPEYVLRKYGVSQG